MDAKRPLPNDSMRHKLSRRALHLKAGEAQRTSLRQDRGDVMQSLDNLRGVYRPSCQILWPKASIPYVPRKIGLASRRVQRFYLSLWFFLSHLSLHLEHRSESSLYIRYVLPLRSRSEMPDETKLEVIFESTNKFKLHSACYFR